MPDAAPEFLPLIHYARRYAQAPASNNAHSNFIIRLQLSTDAPALLAVAREFAFTPDIALPAYQRLVALIPAEAPLSPDDTTVLLEAARAFYAHGYDEMALARVTRLLESNPANVPALELYAALTPDPHQRRSIFERMLEIDPGNRVAVDNLIILDRPK